MEIPSQFAGYVPCKQHQRIKEETGAENKDCEREVFAVITALVIVCGVSFLELAVIIVLALCLREAWKESRDWSEPLYPVDVEWVDCDES